MKKLFMGAVKALDTADKSATVQVALKGADIAGNAIETGSRFVCWLQLTVFLLMVVGALLITDICVRIFT